MVFDDQYLDDSVTIIRIPGETGPRGPRGIDIDEGSGLNDGDILVYDGVGNVWVPQPPSGFQQQYDIGDTGPGGGVVFYVSPGGFLSGTDGNETICHYLEAWTTDLLTSGSSATMAWSGNTNTVVGTGLRIGAGRANTARAVAQNSTADRAITIADSFTNNGLSDWFLPSQDELDDMYFHKTVIGGFAAVNYWSSSESLANVAWRQGFGNGSQDDGAKSLNYRVRPVRAF